jgi:hypothetical protein
VWLKYLASHPKVTAVNYARLKGNKYYDAAQKYLPRGIGSVFTFELAGGREAGGKFIDSLKLISHVANVGDVRTLVVHPATTTHSQLNEEQLKAAPASGRAPCACRSGLRISPIFWAIWSRPSGRPPNNYTKKAPRRFRGAFLFCWCSYMHTRLNSLL